MKKLVWILPLSLVAALSFGTLARSERGARDGCIVDQDAVKEFKKQKAKIRKQEKALKAREKELADREVAFNEELLRLKELRDEIASLETQVNAKQEERIVKLMETLEKMSPKAASKVISTVNDELAINALSRIPTARLAKIMNQMDSARSAHLAQLMSARDWRQKANRKVASKNKTAKGGE